MNQMTTLCYLEQDEKYLMLYRNKKKNDVNEGKWIGVGGHFEEGESPEECLIREVKEETGLTLTKFHLHGIITFQQVKPGEQTFTEYMCLYTASLWEGKTISCDEGDLKWIPKKDLQTLTLWQGDRIFLFLLQENHEFFSMKLIYEGEQLIACTIDGEEQEMFDECTWDGKKTGNVIPRFMAHTIGTVHATAHIWVVRDNGKGSYDILLQKRSCTKDAFPGCWDISSAGHYPAGEGGKPGAIRELGEELGIHATEEQLRYIGIHETHEDTEFYGKPFRNNEISNVYVYDQPVDIHSLSLQKEEVECVQWMELQELKQSVKNNTIKHCLPMSEIERLERALITATYE